MNERALMFFTRHSLDKKEDIWQLKIRVSSTYDYCSFTSHISGLYKNYEMHQWQPHVMGYHESLHLVTIAHLHLT